jgi:toxin ParE1/3/4
MARRVSRKPEVRRDLVGLADYISRDNLDAALRFLDAAERTFNFLAANNQSGQQCGFQQPEIAGLRVWPIEGFRNYLVFYRPTDDGVEILRVLHGARDIEALFGGGA